jgi:hypothetical protein
MFDTASKFVSALEDLLRYVAPGFVGVAMILVAYPAASLPPYLLSVGPPYVLVVGGVLAGVILNSCHVAILEDLLCFLVLCAYRPFSGKLTNKVEKLSSWQMLRRLEARREFRRTSSKKEAEDFQHRHDRFGATLTFLYCASYPGLAIALYQCVMHQQLSRSALLSGLFFLFFGIACDFSYTRHDMWAATHFDESTSRKDPVPQQSLILWEAKHHEYEHDEDKHGS